MFVLALAYLIVLHAGDGREIAINPLQVATLTGPRRDPEHHRLYTDNVRCVLAMTDGKLVSVQESCDVVRRMIEENR